MKPLLYSNSILEMAKKVLQQQGVIQWPYGMSLPDKRLNQSNREYEVERAERIRCQRLMLEWALSYKVRLAKGCCPYWLLRQCSRRCTLRAYWQNDTCAKYGSLNWQKNGWLDHSVCWVKDGKPAIITSAPYDTINSVQEEIREWLSKYDNLSVVYGSGWYNKNTVQVVMWKNDLIPTMTSVNGFN